LILRHIAIQENWLWDDCCIVAIRIPIAVPASSPTTSRRGIDVGGRAMVATGHLEVLSGSITPYVIKARDSMMTYLVSNLCNTFLCYSTNS